MSKLTGIRVNILKHKGQSFANGGISDEFDEAILVLEDSSIPGNIPISGEAPGSFDLPLIVLTAGPLGTVRAQRADINGVPVASGGDKTVGPMAGGSFVASSDSRFSEEVARVLGRRFYGAVSLHDRHESPAQYEALSR